MVITISYTEGAPELYKTSDEPMLSSDVIGKAFGGVSAAVLYKPRLDLLETEGLRIDIWWYSAIPDARTPTTRADEFGWEGDVFNLGLQVGRVWHILDADDLAGVESINIDNRWFVNRRGACLVNETLFRQKLRHYCGARMEEAAWCDQVTALHESIRQQHPDWDDGRIANSYGYPKAAWVEAVAGERKAHMLDEGHKGSTNYTEMVKNARREHPSWSKMEIFNLLNGEGPALSLEDMNETWAEASHEIGLSDDEDGLVPYYDEEEDIQGYDLTWFHPELDGTFDFDEVRMLERQMSE